MNILNQFSQVNLIEKQQIVFRIFVLKPHSGSLENPLLLMNLIDNIHLRVINSNIKLFYNPDATEQNQKISNGLDDIDHFLQYLSTCVRNYSLIIFIILYNFLFLFL